MSDYQRRELDNSLSDYEYYVLRRYVGHTPQQHYNVISLLFQVCSTQLFAWIQLPLHGKSPTDDNPDHRVTLFCFHSTF
jgi:hypothetical protein